MPQVDIYFLPESPPCRAVEMVAVALNVELNKHLVNLQAGDHLKEEYLTINPMGKVPFMVDGDLKINESRAMCTYLVNKYGGADNSLYPKDPVKRAQVDELLFLDIGTIWDGVSHLYKPIFFSNAKTLNPDSEQRFTRALEYLEKRLKLNAGKKFMTGDQLTIGDISLAATLTFCECCGHDMSPYPLLKQYFEVLQSSIHKYHEINDKACENMKKFFDMKRNS